MYGFIYQVEIRALIEVLEVTAVGMAS